MEPLPQSQHSPGPNVRPHPLVTSDSTPPPIPPKDQFASVTRAAGDTTSSGSTASQSNSRMTWDEQQLTHSITITGSSRSHWDQRSTAPSDAPPPYMEEP
ncbi:MAG TPA: hypothetical protein VGO47_07255 [Chlamydiales bacterium]|nr:hypothetical protein [Chlamydiales bacterium]